MLQWNQQSSGGGLPVVCTMESHCNTVDSLEAICFWLFLFFFYWNWANPICPYALSCAEPILCFNTALLILEFRGRLKRVMKLTPWGVPQRSAVFCFTVRNGIARSRLIPAGVSKSTCFHSLLSLGSGFYTAGAHENNLGVGQYWLSGEGSRPSTELEKGNLMVRRPGANRAGVIELSDSQQLYRLFAITEQTL